jgi:hypothetical protein
MAWIEFHPARLKKLQKFGDLRRALGWNVNETLGFLGSFWGEAIELAETGDISGWGPEYLCDLTGLGLNPQRVWDALVEHGWIDRVDLGRFLIHDWLDTAGKWLIRKYGGGAEAGRTRLVEIWALYDRDYGAEHPVTRKGPVSDREVALPNLPLPNLSEGIPPPNLPPGEERRTKHRSKPEEPPIEHWQPMVSHLDKAFEAKRKNKFYWRGQHFKELRGLTRTYQPWGVMALWDEYLGLTDEYTKKAGWSFEMFVTKLPSLLDNSPWKVTATKYEDALLGPMPAEVAALVGNLGAKLAPPPKGAKLHVQ